MLNVILLAGVWVGTGTAQGLPGHCRIEVDPVGLNINVDGECWNGRYSRRFTGGGRMTPAGGMFFTPDWIARTDEEWHATANGFAYSATYELDGGLVLGETEVTWPVNGVWTMQTWMDHRPVASMSFELETGA